MKYEGIYYEHPRSHKIDCTYRIPQVLLQPIAIVDALYVEEGYRGKGIAKDLFRRFQEFASVCGAASIELKVMSRNRDALRLYASMGFCETKKYMALPLSENGASEPSLLC